MSKTIAMRRDGVAEQGTVTIPGAVRFSGVSRTTIYAAIREGQLASCKVGRRRLIYRADLVRFLETAPT